MGTPSIPSGSRAGVSVPKSQPFPCPAHHSNAMFHRSNPSWASWRRWLIDTDTNCKLFSTSLSANLQVILGRVGVYTLGPFPHYAIKREDCSMTDLEFHSEQLAVLPLRLEAVTISGGQVTQQAAIEQINFNNQIGVTASTLTAPRPTSGSMWLR
jgi:hypothetical protein